MSEKLTKEETETALQLLLARSTIKLNRLKAIENSNLSPEEKFEKLSELLKSDSERAKE